MSSHQRATPPGPAPVTLVVGTDDWAIQQASAGLAEAGHTVMRCQEWGASSFPCFGVRGSCPLDNGVEVVLAVRHRMSPEPTPHETGVVCALHRGVPVVAAGLVNGAPYAPFAAALVDRDEDPSTACHLAAALHGNRDPAGGSTEDGTDDNDDNDDNEERINR